MTRGWLALSLLALAGFSQAAFVNGNFETGTFAGWTIGLTPLGATTVQDVVSYDIDGPGALGTSNVARFSAGRVNSGATGNQGVILTQTMMLGTGVHTVDFDWSAFRPTGQASNTQGGIFELIVNGSVIATGTAGATSGAAPKFGHVTGSFTSLGGSHVIGVQITRPFTIPGTPTAPTLFQAVDNFVLTAPVPEPATMAALGLGALALIRRKRAR